MLANITEESKSIIYHLPQVVNTDECIESAQDIERIVGWQSKQHQWKTVLPYLHLHPVEVLD